MLTLGIVSVADLNANELHQHQHQLLVNNIGIINNAMLFMIDIIIPTTHKIQMQPNTTTNNTQRIQQIIQQKYNEEEQKLYLCRSDDDSGDCKDDWRRVLELRNWTALRSL